MGLKDPKVSKSRGLGSTPFVSGAQYEVWGCTKLPSLIATLACFFISLISKDEE